MKDKNAVSLGRKGGKTTLSKYGKEHFQRMGQKSAEKRKPRTTL